MRRCAGPSRRTRPARPGADTLSLLAPLSPPCPIGTPANSRGRRLQHTAATLAHSPCSRPGGCPPQAAGCTSPGRRPSPHHTARPPAGLCPTPARPPATPQPRCAVTHRVYICQAGCVCVLATKPSPGLHPPAISRRTKPRQAPRSRILAISSPQKTLAAVCCLLVAVCWLPAAGCWSLVLVLLVVVLLLLLLVAVVVVLLLLLLLLLLLAAARRLATQRVPWQYRHPLPSTRCKNGDPAPRSASTGA